MKIRRLQAGAPDFDAQLDALLAGTPESSPEVQATVAEIIARVRSGGDRELLALARQHDGVSADSVAALEVPIEVCHDAVNALSEELRDALSVSAQRIRSYAERQRQDSWQFEDEDGNRLGQQVTALDRVGIYVPGGKASYPSTVLMNAIPARVAGVGEIIMTAPSGGDVLNPMVLAAASIAGVDRVFNIGGAQAIAALAWGTETIPAVDKIVGPGNAWVAAAKRSVFGKVGIDMIAGPSEILVIADGSANPEWVAMDLFSQAEHDEDAQAILLSDDESLLEAVSGAMLKQIANMPRADIIRASFEARGALIQVNDLQQAVEVANRVAPEHLELCVDNPAALLDGIRHAGAIFLGHRTPEAFGDYCAGPNHVLPTAGTARFSSPLGVQDFQKRSSVVEVSVDGARRLSPVASAMAHGEGLVAHARAAELRGDD